MAGMSVPAAPLLSVEGLEVTFGTDAPAVCGVDLAVRSGQTVAVVGESGSGKSTTAAAILGLLPAGGRITAGRVVFDGRDITGADAKRLRSIRGREIGYVPQDPMTNLNPVWKVGFQVTEALRANTDGRAARRRAVELLAEAGLPDPAKQAGRYPHQLSGGMCQRALIAIGLAGRPRLLIADEPTSALDVTVQRQVLDHLQGLTDELGTALLLITHDLALAAQRAEAVVVVRRGVVVESGAAQSILQSPQHEYTRRLVAAAPSLTARSQRQRVAIARALALRPEVLVCDEAVSALDVLVQAQILDLLADLQADLGLTYLFISHDLAVIRQIADDVLVMRAGRVVEHASTEEVFSRPRHEYTRQLLQAIPGAPSAPRKVGNL